MDEKLTAMAKSTVFARCSRRELTQLGRLLEWSGLGQGAAIPSGGPGGWLHIVLQGRALGAFEGEPDCLLGEGDVWGRGRVGGGGRGSLIALTDVTVLTVGTRSLAAVESVAPSVASALRRGRIPVPAPTRPSRTYREGRIPAATGAGYANG